MSMRVIVGRKMRWTATGIPLSKLSLSEERRTIVQALTPRVTCCREGRDSLRRQTMPG